MKPLLTTSLLVSALAIAGAPPAHAGRLPLYGGLALCTPVIRVPTGGLASCLATATTPATEPINILLVRLLANKTQTVPSWGYGFAASPGVVTVGWYAEEYVASVSARTRYCQVVIDPADATLTVDFEVHANGVVVYKATEKDLGPCP